MRKEPTLSSVERQEPKAAISRPCVRLRFPIPVLDVSTGRLCHDDNQCMTGYPSDFCGDNTGGNGVEKQLPSIPRKRMRCLCRHGGVGAIDRGFAMPRRGKRVFNIDPPTSSNVVMRRARPRPRRERLTRQEHDGELDIQSPGYTKLRPLKADLLAMRPRRPLCPDTVAKPLLATQAQDSFTWRLLCA